jgi:predicted aminopeptidase
MSWAEGRTGSRRGGSGDHERTVAEGPPLKRRITFRLVRRVVTALLGVLLFAAVAAWYVSPDVRYVVRAGMEEARILLRREPIAALVADPATDPATKAKLELVLAARAFASDSLGLRALETYTTYSKVDRDTLVLVLSASRYDRLAEYTWTYPVVGRVPYKGFFDLEGVHKEARRLERIGMDTYVRPSSAFSTLGYFQDPLLSTVLREDSVELAGTVIHEILHNTVWSAGHVEFNESFANFVGYRGAEAFFRARGDQRNAARAAARWRDELRLGRFYADLAGRLEALYAPGIAGPTLREERLRIFRLAQSDLAGAAGRALETVNGGVLAGRPLNNAAVLAQRLYRTDLEVFDGLLGGHRGDLRATLADVQARVSAGGDPWAVLRAERVR